MGDKEHDNVNHPKSIYNLGHRQLKLQRRVKVDIKNRVVRSDYPYDTVLNFAVTVLESMTEGDLRHYHRQYGLLSASTGGDYEFHIPYITLGQLLDTDGELVDWSIVVLFNSIIATDDNASKIIIGLNGQ